MTDGELIRKVHEGSRKALGQIVERYYDNIYRFCVYLTGSREDSYDITQEVFLRFIRYADSYSSRNLKGYLLIIARNLCRDYFRRSKEFPTPDSGDALGYEEQGLVKAETAVLMTELLTGLSPEQREVILLHIYEELTFREIAKMLDVNLSTVKSRFRLGLNNLRKEMEKANA